MAAYTDVEETVRVEAAALELQPTTDQVREVSGIVRMGLVLVFGGANPDATEALGVMARDDEAEYLRGGWPDDVRDFMTIIRGSIISILVEEVA